MAVSDSIQRPVVFKSAAWDGTNVSDMNDVLATTTAWSFSTDNGGQLVGHFYSIPVPVGNYVTVAPLGTPMSLSASDFIAQFAIGSGWVVAS